MNFNETELQGVLLLEPKLFKDERGFFMETFQAQDFSKAGIPINFVQDNQSGSYRGVLRGLHYQIERAQGKLVRVTIGEVYDVVVDLRRKSPTFGKSAGFKISSDDKKQLWIPAGFAHGFYVLSDWAEVNYKATDYYAPQYERTLLWNDPVLDIQWPLAVGQGPIISTKDAHGSPLATAEIFNHFG